MGAGQWARGFLVGVVGVTGSGLVACSKDKEEAGDAGAGAAVAADAGPAWRFFVVQDSVSRPLNAQTGPLKVPITVRAWLPGQDSKQLSAKASAGDGHAKLQMDFAASPADGGVVAQVTLTDPAAQGKVTLDWLSKDAEGAVKVITSSTLEVAAPAKAEPEAATAAKPGKGAKGKAAKGKKKKKH